MILMGLIGQACERKLHENNVCTRFIHPSTHEICINLHTTISDGKEMKGSLVGGFTPSEKYESQLGLLFSIYGKIKNVPNHQPDKYMYLSLLGGLATHTNKMFVSSGAHHPR